VSHPGPGDRRLLAGSLTRVNALRGRRADDGDMIKTGLFLPGHRPAQRRWVPVLGATAAAAAVLAAALAVLVLRALA
jgi:hypothetical protein